MLGIVIQEKTSRTLPNNLTCKIAGIQFNHLRRATRNGGSISSSSPRGECRCSLSLVDTVRFAQKTVPPVGRERRVRKSREVSLLLPCRCPSSASLLLQGSRKGESQNAKGRFAAGCLHHCISRVCAFRTPTFRR